MDTSETMNGMQSALRHLADNWWLLLVQGVVSIIFGILALIWPGETLAVLVVLFGWFVLFIGAIAIVSAIAAATNHQQWGWRFAVGILGVLAGLIILRWPGITAVTLLLFVGFWAIVVGLTQIIGAIAHHDEVPSPWLLALEGAVAILFGIAMIVWPAAGLLTLALLIGIFAIIYGIIACVIAFRVRSLGQHLPTQGGQQAGPTPAY